MPALSDLVLDLPPRVARAAQGTHEMRDEVLSEPYSSELHDQWLRDLDAEVERRSMILPCDRTPRIIDPEAIRDGSLADLVIERNRHSVGHNGPAPATREGLAATLRSFVRAQEPCDRYDALIRHAATALMFAEEIAAGRA